MSKIKFFGVSLIICVMTTSCSLSPQAPIATEGATTVTGDAATSLGKNGIFVCGDSVTLQTTGGQQGPKTPTDPKPTPGEENPSGC
jgi:hypothetical protein